MANRILLLCTLAVLMLVSIFPRFVRGFMDERLVIDVLDVGQGDAILLSQGDERVLVDGGPDHKVTQTLPESLPIFAQDFSLVVMTHPHADHIDGLFDVLERYTVRELVIPDVAGIEKIGRLSELLALAKKNDVVVRRVVRGDVLEVGRMQFTVLAPERGMPMPEDVNDVSVVMSLRDQDSDGDDEILLTGDAGFDTEDDFRADGVAVPRVEMLKVGHHGSSTATGELFLAEVQPRWAVFSAAKKNRYGHPSKKAVARIESARAEMVNTADGGTATFVLENGCLHLVGRGGELVMDMVEAVFLKKSLGSCTISPN